ncbi:MULTISPECIES: GntR family transcriptional regulator [Neobacillus]|uniref:GntR family transcriptional regulator n=1 Tax=Neobacillus rhizophilus TaxID=2833579 RepID=A0A942YTE9_9BACI|nr:MULTISPECIES: GntR family transcriptional regulator [Neobacillus]MBS4212848.1 GntR family transcriptional regulator [Neobacillus rhizophilus]MBU8919023.1 GntR family transcriptional regulator [Bacillus sp. FJAT-29953]
MNVNRKKGPLYLQIKEILKDRILHGEYALNTNIPSEPQLEEEFNVSKITVRNAIKELVQEGYLEKRSGKGTKVIANVTNARLSKGKRFTEILVEEGHHITKKILGVKRVELSSESALHSIFGDHCIQVERIYLLDNEPYIHFTHYILLDLSEEEVKDIRINSLYRFLEEHNIRLESFRDEFAVAIAPPHICETLKLEKDTALLKRMRHSSDDEGNVLEYSEGYYHTAKHNYIVTYNDSIQ